MDFLKMATDERFTARAYTDKPVEKEKLDKILEVIRLAPSAKNLQPIKVRVIQSAENLAKLNEHCKCIYGATTVLLFTYLKDEEWVNPFEDAVRAGVEDVSIAATHAMIMATELGLNTTWINAYPNTELETAFNIPSNERSVLLMNIGYAPEGTQPAENHFKSKTIEQIVEYI